MSSVLSRSIKRAGRSLRQQPLRFEALEDRRLLAATTVVDDDFAFVADLDSSGTVSVGDQVLAPETGQTLIYGVTAFGTVATGTFTGSDPAADTITEAIAATTAGGKVRVLEGNYTEDVVVSKSVKLLGANAGIPAVPVAGTRGDETVITGGFIVQADNVVIDGFTILNGANVGEPAGVFLAAGASNVVIANNIIDGAGTGRGILSTFNGENDDIVIRNNEIFDWTTGIFNQTNEDVDVLGNYIHDNTAGVANDFVDDVRISGNVIVDNAEGVGVNQSTGVVIRYNDLAGNTVAIKNYGGPQVDALFNWYGTTPTASLVQGDVDFTPFLPSSILSGDNLVFAGAQGQTLVVNRATGAFTLYDAEGAILLSGTARLRGNSLQAKYTEDDGDKIQISGSAKGTVKVSIKPDGKGKGKTEFRLANVLTSLR